LAGGWETGILLGSDGIRAFSLLDLPKFHPNYQIFRGIKLGIAISWERSMTGAFMRKALLPMLASLALCGTATFALITSNAHAQPEQKRPMMVALVTPAMAVNRVASGESGGSARPTGRMHMPSPAEIAAHMKQMCQDGYAREAGTLAYTEAKLSLNATQQPLFEHWKQVRLDIAKRRATACASRERPKHAAMPSLVDRMARREDMLKLRLANLDAERPMLESLYNSLSPTQKREFGRGLAGMAPHGMAHRMFAGGRGMMRPGMMGRMMMRGPMSVPPPGLPGEAPPPPPPQ
jgi:hypothetical protein